MSRDAILKDIRTALDKSGSSEKERARAAAAHLADPPTPLVPARIAVSAPERIALFKAFLAAQGTTCIAVTGPAEVPGAIAGYLGAHALPLRIRKGTEPYLAALPWPSAPELIVAEGPAQPDDGAGLSLAVAGVAETGTLVLASGAHNPVTLAFVPETHIVVVSAGSIVGSYEDALALLAAEPGERGLPRTLNLISGASRTGDIGGRIVMGAHGPRRLAVVLVEGA